MFRIYTASIRFSRLQSKVRRGVQVKDDPRKDRFVLPLPPPRRAAVVASESALREQAPCCGGSEPPVAPVDRSGEVRV